MPKRKMRCFVASAFDRSDVDQVYRKIKKLLRRMKITPLRVDELEHNDEITDKIRKELQAADFVIADLTYARPSVYYEAGYAERTVPVIYIARNDHFKPRIDDEHGNYRVNFDVQNKNTIKWKNGGDDVFLQRLERRIINVTKPIVREIEKDFTKKREEEDFKRLSEAERIFRCSDLFKKEMRKKHWKWSFKDRGAYPDLYRVKNNVFQYCISYFGGRINKGDCALFRRWFPGNQKIESEVRGVRSAPDKKVGVSLFVTFDSFNSSVLKRYNPLCRRIDGKGFYILFDYKKAPIGEYKCCFVVLEKVVSVSDSKDRLLGAFLALEQVV